MFSAGQDNWSLFKIIEAGVWQGAQIVGKYHRRMISRDFL
jgi:hypothetical protein